MFSVICIFSVLIFVIFNFLIGFKKYETDIEKYSQVYDLESALVFAIARVESDFEASAVSSSGARGVMQIMPITAKWIAGELGDEYSDDNLFDPETNIRYGCFYLRYLLDKFDDLWVVVAAYNAGESVVKSWVGEDGLLNEDLIDYDETKKYVSRVRMFYRLYKNLENAI